MKNPLFWLALLGLSACQMHDTPVTSDYQFEGGVKAPEGMASSADEMILTSDGRLVLRGDQ